MTATTTRTFHAELKTGRRITILEQGSVEQAAAAAAATFYPRNRNLTVMRTTGTAGLSGWFQAYVPIGNEGGLSSYGESFHVGN